MKEREDTELMSINTELSPVDIDDNYSSYIFTTSQRDLSIYGERLLMEVIQRVQNFIMNSINENNINFIQGIFEQFAVIDIPIKALLLKNEDTNYEKAKSAAMELMKVYHTVETPVLDSSGNPVIKKGKPEYKWMAYHLLEEVYVNEKRGYISVKMGERTWRQILDMGKGYVRYNLQAAKTLELPTAIRLFQLLNNINEPVCFTLEYIRKMLGMGDKYKKANGAFDVNKFINVVIVKAEQEIKEKCPFEIVHELKKTRSEDNKRLSYTHIIFSKKEKEATSTRDIFISPALKNLLQVKYGFTERELFSNISLISDFEKVNSNPVAYLDSIEKFIHKATNPKGYIIKSMKTLLQKSLPQQSSDPETSYSDGSKGKRGRKKRVSLESILEKETNSAATPTTRGGKKEMRIQGSEPSSFKKPTGLEEL